MQKKIIIKINLNSLKKNLLRIITIKGGAKCAKANEEMIL